MIWVPCGLLNQHLQAGLSIVARHGDLWSLHRDKLAFKMSRIRQIVTKCSNLIVALLQCIGVFLKEGHDDGMLIDVDPRDWENMPKGICKESSD